MGKVEDIRAGLPAAHWATFDELIGFGIDPRAAAQSARNKAEGLNLADQTRERDDDAIANGQNVVRIDRADGLSPQGIEWIWPGYLARRKLHSIAGPAGTNKTTAAIAIASTITQGGRWPDGSVADVGSVLVWSGEDGIEDTLLGRAIAHGAELSRLYFVRGTHSANGSRAFDPSSDMKDLASKAARIPGLALLIVDPVVLTVKGDSNTNGDVRRGLQPLVELAERTGAAAIGITHFSKGTTGKNPVERVTGSLAFGAAPRIVLAVAKMPAEQGGGRVLLRAKSNIGPDGGGFRFDVEPITVQGIETIRILWRGPIEGDAHDILSAAERIEDPDEREATDDARSFLRETIADAGGSMDRKSIIAAGRRAGYNERALERARGRAGVHSRTQGFGAGKRSMWSINTVTDPPSKNGVGNDANDGIGSLSSSNTVNTVNNDMSAGVRARDGYEKASRGE